MIVDRPPFTSTTSSRPGPPDPVAGPRGGRAVLVVVVMLLGVLGCSAGSGSAEGEGIGVSGPRPGGTLYVLVRGQAFAHLDPQRNYTGADLGFATAFLNRTLTTYRVAAGRAGTEMVPDLATDLGTALDRATRWRFTLREGVTFEDGTPIRCSDVKYGISRTFAQDVITDGPTYAISMLDVPRTDDGRSVYTGPYRHSTRGQAAFDRAVTCSEDDRTITFALSRPVPDFNAALTLPAFGPVPAELDTGDGYDLAPVSSGPYRIAASTASSLELVRNRHWDADSDPVRAAFPDRVVVQFGISPQEVDRRLERSVGADAYAVAAQGIDAADLPRLFADPALADRRSNQLDPFVRYLAINTQRVPQLGHRRALMAALDRESLHRLAGGDFAGDHADGVIKPNLGQDYAPTGIWESGLGAPVPPGGNLELARRLIAEAGPPPPIVLDYNRSPDDRTQDEAATIIRRSWERAGFTVRLNPIEQSAYSSTVQDATRQGSVSFAGWGPDWLNASTVICELFTPGGGYPLSRYRDPAFLTRVVDAVTTLDRAEQAGKWQALNREAVELGLVIPLRFSMEQLIFGARVRTAGLHGRPYSSPAWGGPQFADLYLAP